MKVVDLALDLYDGAPTMPMDPKCSVTEHCNLDTLGYNLARVTMSTHQGTHMDAPYHFYYDGQTIDRLDPARCIGPAFIADLSHKKAGQAIEPMDLEPYDGKIAPGANVLLRTGWDKEFPRSSYFSGFPYVTPELAEYLAGRRVNLLGMDIPTPNGAQWKQVHETLLGAGVIIVEGLANLEAITAGSFTFIALPLRIRGRDGSPVRAVAVEP